MGIGIVPLEQMDPLEDVLVKLYLRCYEGMEEYAYSAPRDVKRYLRWLCRRTPFSFFLAVKGDEPVGFLVADDHWEEDGETVGEIHEVVVAPEERGKGVGSALVQRALDHFREKGLKKVGLWVGRRNKRAKAFYTHLGFKEGDAKGKWIRMERPLE